MRTASVLLLLQPPLTLRSDKRPSHIPEVMHLLQRNAHHISSSIFDIPCPFVRQNSTDTCGISPESSWAATVPDMLSIHVASASIDRPDVSTADFQLPIGSVPFLKDIGISILPIPNGLGKRYGCDIFSAALPLRTDAHFHQVMGRQCCGTGRISLSSFFL